MTFKLWTEVRLLTAIVSTCTLILSVSWTDNSGLEKRKHGLLLPVKKQKLPAQKHSPSRGYFGIFIAWRQRGHSLTTQTAALEGMIDSRTPMAHVL